jgi:TonB family protein
MQDVVVYCEWPRLLRCPEVPMLDVLVSSCPPYRRRPQDVMVSVLTHALFLALVVQATRASVDMRPAPVADTTLMFFRRLAPPAVRPVEAPGPKGHMPGNANVIVVADPPPKGFQTIVAPKDIPTTIPPIDLKARALDPRDYTGRGVEGGVGHGVVGGTGKVDPESPAEEDVVYLATTDDVRFEPAVLISQPIPKYPPVLREIGLSGRVVLQFIVDTTGRVDSASIRVMESTNDGFEAPARESVAAAVFHPARLGPQPVRQRARQPVRFIATQ